MKDFIEKFMEAVEIEDASNLNAETKFRELEEWNSLAVISIIAMFDEEYGKEIGDVDLENCQTIGDLYNLTSK